MRVAAVMIAVSVSVLSAQAPQRVWKLPSSLALKQDGPRIWAFHCTYTYLDTKGQISRRELLSALYTRGLPGESVRWTGVTSANANGESGGFGPPAKQDYMEGFTYPYAAAAGMLDPAFFHGFPAMAMQERNLVWDTHMLEGFGQEHFADLQLGVPWHVPETAEIQLAGMGSFQHRDLQLVWTGITQRNGQECAVIDYRALFNKLQIKNPAMALVGRSNYWGQVWVSLTTKNIEYATLFEDVSGELTLPGQAKPMIINVFRSGVFEPVAQP